MDKGTTAEALFPEHKAHLRRNSHNCFDCGSGKRSSERAGPVRVDCGVGQVPVEFLSRKGSKPQGKTRIILSLHGSALR